jgi:hypothetical protein
MPDVDVRRLTLGKAFIADETDDLAANSDGGEY